MSKRYVMSTIITGNCGSRAHPDGSREKRPHYGRVAQSFNGVTFVMLPASKLATMGRPRRLTLRRNGHRTFATSHSNDSGERASRLLLEPDIESREKPLFSEHALRHTEVFAVNDVRLSPHVGYRPTSLTRPHQHVRQTDISRYSFEEHSCIRRGRQVSRSKCGPCGRWSLTRLISIPPRLPGAPSDPSFVGRNECLLEHNPSRWMHSYCISNLARDEGIHHAGVSTVHRIRMILLWPGVTEDDVDASINMLYWVRPVGRNARSVTRTSRTECSV